MKFRALLLAAGLAVVGVAHALPSSATAPEPTTTTTAATSPSSTTTVTPTPAASSTTTTAAATTTTTVAESTASEPEGASPDPNNGPIRSTVPDTRPPEGGTGPTRGPGVQVTPTLPPPTTTTTIAPELVLPANSGVGRRVVYSNSLMRVWAVESDGTVVKTHRVSGKRYVPNPGEYSVFSRSLYTYSRVHPNITWMYMVRFAHSASGDNIGFHEIPTECVNGVCWKLQTEAQLGQPLSGGCVRQSTADAIWMWNWAYLGTKVVVLP